LKQAPTARIANSAVTGAKIETDVALAGNPTTTTQTSGNNTTRLATTAFVQTAAGLLVPKSTVAAKGDIIVGTAASTVAAHTAGSNGNIPVFDSTQTDGIQNRIVAAASPALLMQASATIVAGQTSLTRLMGYGTAAAAIATDMKNVPLLYWTSAAFGLTNWTQQVMLVLMLQTNATAPTGTFTATLRSVTANAGAATLITGTLGSALSGSSVAIATPPAGGQQTGNSGWITAPTTNSGMYALAIDNSATLAANSQVMVTAMLYGRYIN
jgi:hypothetical protein